MRRIQEAGGQGIKFAGTRRVLKTDDKESQEEDVLELSFRSLFKTPMAHTESASWHVITNHTLSKL